MPLPDDVEAHELDRDTRKQLLSLAKDTAELVARHLVMAGRLMDDEPTAALAHARAARALAGRVGAVREANGLVAYVAGEWAEALSELRTARRLTGDPEHLPVMADCERALGRPDRALLMSDDPQASALSPAARVELLIVASGARRDLGQAGAAVVSLQVAALEGPVRPWTARLRYAYADALLDAGREDEARQWFARTADVDEQGETDADERLLLLDGVVFEDLEHALDDDDAPPPVISATDLVAMVADMSTPKVTELPRGHAQGGEADGAGAVPTGHADVAESTDPVTSPPQSALEAAFVAAEGGLGDVAARVTREPTGGVPAITYEAPETGRDQEPDVPAEAPRPPVADPGFRAPGSGTRRTEVGPDDELTLFD